MDRIGDDLEFRKIFGRRPRQFQGAIGTMFDDHDDLVREIPAGTMLQQLNQTLRQSSCLVKCGNDERYDWRNLYGHVTKFTYYYSLYAGKAQMNLAPILFS